jgi:hypothetical protein
MSCRVSGLFHLAEGRVMREGFVLVVRVTAPVCSGAGLVLSSLCKRAALSRFIHKRGGGAGGGGGARRPVESWRCSRDEVMLVDCWEPAMGIKVMKGHMQKRGESTFGSTERFYVFFLIAFLFLSACVRACVLGRRRRRQTKMSVCLSTPLL